MLAKAGQSLSGMVKVTCCHSQSGRICCCSAILSWNLLMVKSLLVVGVTDSDFPMSSITGRANLLLTTSIGGGVYAGIKMA